MKNTKKGTGQLKIKKKKKDWTMQKNDYLLLPFIYLFEHFY